MEICEDLPRSEDHSAIYRSNRMTGGKPANVTASVRQRLLNIIRETGDDSNIVWTRYVTERLLYRLSISEYAGECHYEAVGNWFT